MAIDGSSLLRQVQSKVNTLVFARQAKLFAIRFDPKLLKVSGNPVQVLDGVTQSLYGIAGVTWTGAAQFSVAENGTLLYAPGSIEPPLFSALVWYDRNGKPSPVTGTRPMLHFAARRERPECALCPALSRARTSRDRYRRG